MSFPAGIEIAIYQQEAFHGPPINTCAWGIIAGHKENIEKKEPSAELQVGPLLKVLRSMEIGRREGTAVGAIKAQCPASLGTSLQRNGKEREINLNFSKGCVILAFHIRFSSSRDLFEKSRCIL